MIFGTAAAFTMTVAQSAAAAGPHLGSGPGRAGAAPSVTAPGSLLYVKKNDIWLTNSTASTTVRITKDGGTATTDGTGGVGYHVPSQPKAGNLVVAVRNQNYSPGYQQGWIHVMSRTGATVRSFMPPQYAFIADPGSSCPVKADQVPRGIVNASVSPDGKHIAYVAWTYEESIFDCSASVGYMTYVVNVDGTGAHQIARSDGDAADLEIGAWNGNSQLLLDDGDFGSVAFWYVTLPSHTAVEWSDAPDYLDAAYALPALSKGKLASVGYSEYNEGNAMRLWTSGNPPAQPDPKCEYLTDAFVSGDYADRPTWAPKAVAVAWDIDDGNAKVRSGEGVYVVSVGKVTCSSTPRLLVPGGIEPFWSPAPVNLSS